MINSFNSWGNLKEIVVGTATNAHWPVNCPVFRQKEISTSWKETPVPRGPVDEAIIKEANDDLDNFCHILTSLGITVHRPTNLDFKSFDGMYNYCPRDRILVIGDNVIDAPMAYPTRIPEIEGLQHVLPTSIIHCNDPTAMFDAANVCRLGFDLLYLISQTGNNAGATWLQEVLGSQYKVHKLDNIYNGVHIDSTISPVREGLVVLNADRINDNNLPLIFKSWDKIWITGNQVVEQPFVHYPYAGKYIALNFLVVNPKLIICDPKQSYLINELKKYGVDCIGTDLRHSRTLGGGHHCVTLDLIRE